MRAACPSEQHDQLQHVIEAQASVHVLPLRKTEVHDRVRRALPRAVTSSTFPSLLCLLAEEYFNCATFKETNIFE